MVLHVLTDAAQFMDNRHGDPAEMLGIADTRQLQYVRGQSRPADRITSRIAPARSTPRELNADRTFAVEQHAMDHRVSDELQVGPFQRRVQIGARGSGAAVAAAGLLAPADAVAETECTPRTAFKRKHDCYRSVRPHLSTNVFWGLNRMSLTHFAVVHEHAQPLDRVLVHCFDDRQMVLVFISREAIDDYFQRLSLRPRDRNLLINRNLEHLIPVIVDKYDRGEVGEYVGSGAQRFPQIDLDLADLEGAPEKLTDTVLDIAARAGFQRG
jgi:hypothetical protein